MYEIRFLREFAHKFPQTGGNLKISEGIRKFPEGEARGKFSNSRGYFQIHDVQGNLCANSREKTEFLANFFTNLFIFLWNLYLPSLRFQVILLLKGFSVVTFRGFQVMLSHGIEYGLGDFRCHQFSGNFA